MIGINCQYKHDNMSIQVYNLNKNSIFEIIRLKVPYKSIYANEIIQYEDIGICNVVYFGGAVIKN